MAVPDSVKEFLREVPAIPRHYEIFITKVGFLSGSRRYGVGAPDTDYDYIMMESQLKSLPVDLCYESNNYDFGQYSSWYLKCEDGKVFNVLAMKTRWCRDQYLFATDQLLANCKASDEYLEKLRSKDFRVAEFHKYKAIFEKDNGYAYEPE